MPPPFTTTSTCTVEGTHLFHIEGYSFHERLVAGKSICSAAISVSGYDWAVHIYNDNGDEGSGAMVLHLELLTKNATATASWAFRYLNPATGAASGTWPVPLLSYRSGIVSKTAKVITFTWWNSLKYAHDDRLTIECVVTVLQKPKISKVKAITGVEEPASVSSENLNFGSLLEEKDGSDVTFVVQGESMSAHKVVLAAQSPVFKEKFYGREMEESVGCIAVDDVRPDVFRVLLYFIYTDLIPDMDDLSDDDRRDMFWNLLVAADRYEIKRLVLMCETNLCKTLSTDSVASTLALSEQHNLGNLKDACIEFVAFSKKIDEVVASQVYARLKRSCPSVLLEIFEKSIKLRKV